MGSMRFAAQTSSVTKGILLTILAIFCLCTMDATVKLLDRHRLGHAGGLGSLYRPDRFGGGIDLAASSPGHAHQASNSALAQITVFVWRIVLFCLRVFKH